IHRHPQRATDAAADAAAAQRPAAGQPGGQPARAADRAGLRATAADGLVDEFADRDRLKSESTRGGCGLVHTRPDAERLIFPLPRRSWPSGRETSATRRTGWSALDRAASPPDRRRPRRIDG